jgi:hypothetical protein
MTADQEITATALKQHVNALKRTMHSAAVYERDSADKAKHAVKRAENAAIDLAACKAKVAAATEVAAAYNEDIS